MKWGLAGLLGLLGASELGSESVTLTTYYPAPSGVYAQMITTNNTFLARDGGSVGVGTASPAQKLDVSGAIRMNQAGVGALLSGAASGNFGGKEVILSVNSGAGGAGDEIWIGPNTGGMIGHIQLNAADIWLNNPANLGYARLNNGHLYMNTANTACTAYTISGDVWTSLCPANTYATWTPGVWVEGYSYQNRGGTVLADYGTGTTNQVWGLNTANGQASWMTLKKDDSTAMVYCCSK
ncbi:MAG: hypothetical protein HY921_07625 [Elusimicrobia bacterium]|nr:hypothetical protein [Elusimicrobiota bacterium]